MPIIDGFMFMYEYEKLSEVIKSHCQIIILSSSDNQGDIQRMIGNSYVNGFITKPLNSVALKEMCPTLTINAKNVEHIHH
jgi:CheY-like chemotaxis protein